MPMVSSTYRVCGRLLREPLVHFILIGTLMFAWWTWHGAAADSGRIVVKRALVDQLASGFARNWGREPSTEELKLLIDDHVKEEIAGREAVALGLDRDDVIIRRRLRQKVEFLLTEDAGNAAPTELELKAWLDRHPDSLSLSPQIAFRQVLVSPERHAGDPRAVAAALLKRLRTAGPGAAAEGVGDATMLPVDSSLEPVTEVERGFGRDFADALMQVEPGQWQGPIESSYGLHLVLVQQRIEGGTPDPVAVRPLVEREVQSEKRTAAMQALYERLLGKYEVVVDAPR